MHVLVTSMTSVFDSPKAVLTMTTKTSVPWLVTVLRLSSRIRSLLSSCVLVSPTSFPLVLTGARRNNKFFPVMLMYRRSASMVLSFADVI